MPSTLKHIGDKAFYRSGIRGDLVIPEGVTYLGEKCFGVNTELRSLFIPDTVQYIGKDLFESCWRLDQVVLPKGMKSIPVGMFFDCRNLKIDFLNGIESIGQSAFSYLETNKLVIPLSVQSIGAYAFEHASISSFEYEGTMSEWSSIELALETIEPDPQPSCTIDDQVLSVNCLKKLSSEILFLYFHEKTS